MQFCATASNIGNLGLLQGLLAALRSTTVPAPAHATALPATNLHACAVGAPPLLSAGPQQGLPWADRFAYCQPGSALSPDVHLAGSYWQPNCVMPLGQIYWVLAVQASGLALG